VKRFNPEEPNNSDSFNPLSEAISYTEIEKMAVLLVLAGLAYSAQNDHSLRLKLIAFPSYAS